MNVVLFDPDLSFFLASIWSSKVGSGNFAKKSWQDFLCSTPRCAENHTVNPQNTHEVGDHLTNTPYNTQDSNCFLSNYNVKCTIESNLSEISNLICKLICKISPLGATKLNVYLLVQNEFELLSTILLNYIKSLYSLVVMNSTSHCFNHSLEILLTIDLTILPICNFNSFNKVKIVDLNSIDGSDSICNTGNNFIYFNSRFICNSFYGSNSTLSCTGLTVSSSQGVPDTHQLLEGGESDDNVVLYIRRYDNIMFCGTFFTTLVAKYLINYAISSNINLGTFDYLHYGHKLLLLAAFLSCKKNLFIGVVALGDLISKKTDFEKVQPLETRKDMVKSYLNDLQLLYSGNFKSNSSFLNSDKTTPTGSGKYFEEGSSSSGCVFNYMSIDFSISGVNGSFTKHNPVDDSPDYFAREGRSSFSCQATSGPNLSVDIDSTGNGVTIKLFDLFDILGPSNRLSEKFGLLVTPELMKNAQHVNEVRLSLNLVPWDLIVVGIVCYLKGDELIKLSSSSIRNVI